MFSRGDAAKTVPQHSTEPARAGRFVWMDTLRATAVVLVVLEHAVLLPFSLTPGWLWALNAAVTPFRIPTLMFLSGMLLARSLAKPVKVYLRGKVNRILWPSVVWSMVQLLVSLRWGAPESTWWQELLRPSGPMFYLQYLLIFYVLALVIPAAARTIGVLPLLVVAELIPQNAELTRALFLLAFFFAGDTLSRYADSLMPFIQRRLVVAVCSAISVVLAVASASTVDVRYDPLAAVGTMAGVVAAISVCKAVSRTPAGRIVSRYGRHTVIFYVVSWPAQIVARDELIDAGFTNGPALVAALLVVGLGVGWLFVAAQDHLPGVRYLFDLSRPRR